MDRDHDKLLCRIRRTYVVYDAKRGRETKAPSDTPYVAVRRR